MGTTNTFSPPPSSMANKRISLPRGSRVTVVGAGAFGGWSALWLLRAGYKVTLIDAWGAGNSRSSSGDETRVIRSTYGDNGFYFDLNVRALSLWKEHQALWNTKLFYNVGVLWFCYHEKNPLVDASTPFAKKHHMEYEYLSVADIQKRYPMVHTGNLSHAWHDPYGGYLKAREATQAVQEAFVNEGGLFKQAHATPARITGGLLQGISLSDGTTVHSDAYLFACGAWLGQLFPEVLGNVITCTRQEVFYFGVPEGQAGQYERMPSWVDVDGKDFYYGIPGNAHRGFKVGVDLRGGRFDPTTGDRIPDPQVLAGARQFMEMRFPGLKNAPVVENRVCPYENSPDGNFIFEAHPEASNLWFLGGGSGHGFKHGPALGELVMKGFVEA